MKISIIHQNIDHCPLYYYLILCCVFLSHSLSASTTSHPRCLRDQSSILLQFKQEFPLKQSEDHFGDYSDPKMETWKANTDCCSWNGVACDKTGHVIGLDLSSSSLQGPLLSNSSLFRLVQLQQLNLASNDFSFSEISLGFSNFKSLNVLYLNNCNFSGTIPASLGNLSQLTDLVLSVNNFSGQLPSTLGNLAKLTTLELVSAQLTGEVPFSLGSLTKLESLHLSDNHFGGRIPSSLGNLSQLTELELSHNKLSGEFPTSLANLTQLQLLGLSYNELTGSIPSDIQSSISLQTLDLSHNSFTGIIPPSLFRMPSLLILNLDYNELTGPFIIQNVTSSQLEFLYLRRNKLNGRLPGSISRLTNLKEIYLFSNNLSGRVELGVFSKLSKLETLDLSDNSLSVTDTGHENLTLHKFTSLLLSSCNITEFPMFLKTQNELWLLDLSHNKIEGEIPKWFFTTGTETLNVLDLSSNFITGWEQPMKVLPWKVLDFLDLRHNKFRGSSPVPPFSTRHFFASNNSLSGKLHSLFCKLGSLKVLDLSTNQLSGEIPPCLGFNSSLVMLNLQKNNFHGGIPQTCKEGSVLKTLDLSHNQLQGNVPKSLIKCEELEVLNIGYNKISDEFPFWSQNLLKLQVLVLRNNNFHGPIWLYGKFFGFKKLRIMDLSFNNFDGDLSSEYFRNWSALNTEIPSANKSKLRYMGDVDNYYQDTMNLTNKGLEMVLKKILTTLSSIDISYNNFHGEIPSSLGDLKSLKVLNLSRNNFEGLIPSSLGKLSELESLDLSKNNLVGTIPQQLKDLTFLSFLNLSDNQLKGQIPQGGQFNTFQNSSFGGNLDLCDFPLSKKCERTPTPELQSSESKNGFGWKTVVMGYGCGLLIGVTIEQVVALRRPNLFARIYT